MCIIYHWICLAFNLNVHIYISYISNLLRLDMFYTWICNNTRDITVQNLTIHHRRSERRAICGLAAICVARNQYILP